MGAGLAAFTLTGGAFDSTEAGFAGGVAFFSGFAAIDFFKGGDFLAGNEIDFFAVAGSLAGFAAGFFTTAGVGFLTGVAFFTGFAADFFATGAGFDDLTAGFAVLFFGAVFGVFFFAAMAHK